MSLVLLKFMWRRHRVSVLLLGILPLLIGVVVGLLYPTYSKERELLKVLKYTSRFFGNDQMDMFSPDGAFSLPFQHPLVLIAYAILPAIAAIGMPAGDRGTKGLDLILATPLSRAALGRTVWFFQILGSLYLVFITWSSANLAGWLGGEYEHVKHGAFLALALLSFALMGAFGAVSMIISVLSRDRGQATLVFGITTTVFFLIDVTARMWKDGAWLAWLTPYGFMRPARIMMAETGLSGVVLRDIGVLLAFGIVGHLIAAALHRRRLSV